MPNITEVERGRWYPDVPPALPGETDDAYTNRLTGPPDRRPYDHPRNRQCSIGYHGECSDPAGEVCKCPHHTDPGPPDAAEVNTEAADILAGLYYLPDTSAQRVMHVSEQAIKAGEVTTLDGLRSLLGELYGSTIGEGFAIDVAGILGYRDKLGN